MTTLYEESALLVYEKFDTKTPKPLDQLYGELDNDPGLSALRLGGDSLRDFVRGLVASGMLRRTKPGLLLTDKGQGVRHLLRDAVQGESV